MAQRCNYCLSWSDRYYISPLSQAPYCVKCWEEIHPPGSKTHAAGKFIMERFPRTAEAKEIAAATKKEDESVTSKITRWHECKQCHHWLDEENMLGVADEWICETCLEKAGGEDVDVKLPPVAHIKMKAKGSPNNIEFFQFVMTNIDKDWPKIDAPKCPDCDGVTWRMPCIELADLKKLAQDCGVGKLKVPYFGDAEKCKVAV